MLYSIRIVHVIVLRILEMCLQIRLGGKFVRKSKADKVKRIQEGFSRFDLLRKPESSGVINVEQ